VIVPEEIPTVCLNGRFWRMLSPRYSCDPLSGKGAARFGGKYNPVGFEALYLSLEYETAISEYMQEIQRPGTLCAYDLEITDIVDLLDPNVQLEFEIDRDFFYSDWKESGNHET
jgi:RES domain-containing protein